MGSNPASPTIFTRLVLVAALGLGSATAVEGGLAAAQVAEQRIIVEVASRTATVGTLRMIEIVDGRELTLLGPVTARVGRNGVKRDRREGDGTTPLGTTRITAAFGRASAADVGVPYRRVVRGDCWISDVADRDYNRWVRRDTCRKPNEDLNRIATAGPYEFALVTNFNVDPIKVGKGSAIFIHVHARDASGGSKPTSGCVSVARRVMKRLFALVDAAKNPQLVVRLRR